MIKIEMPKRVKELDEVEATHTHKKKIKKKSPYAHGNILIAHLCTLCESLIPQRGPGQMVRFGGW